MTSDGLVAVKAAAFGPVELIVIGIGGLLLLAGLVSWLANRAGRTAARHPSQRGDGGDATVPLLAGAGIAGSDRPAKGADGKGTPDGDAGPDGGGDGAGGCGGGGCGGGGCGGS